MPEITRFYGIVIKMYFMQKEHNLPHIHALYGNYMSAIDIKTMEVLEGDLPNKALDLVKEWMKDHQMICFIFGALRSLRHFLPLYNGSINL
jgi:hypothetical protein